ncbi:MAG: acetyl-CoA carboxylase biotin carboxyl carrier protein [Bacteroidales bacterium]
MKKYKFKITGYEYEVGIINVEDGIAELEVNGTKYSVELEQELMQSKKTPVVVQQKAAPKPGEGVIVPDKSGTSKLKAPLPGTIFKMLVKEGDTIEKGQTVLIMEAMKMENEINADKAGVVSTVKVKEGDAVLDGDVLIEIS